MKNSGHLSLRSLFVTGAVAALAALPQSASAQLVGGFMRSGVVSPGQSAPAQQAAPAPQSAPMRSGTILRGAVPFNRNAPMPGSGPVTGNGPIFGRGPGFNPPMSSNPQPIYGRGGGYGYGNNNNGSGPYGNNGGGETYGNGPGRSFGPVVTVPEQPYYPSYGGAYGRQPFLPPVGPGNGFFRNPIPPVGPANGYFTNPIPPVGPANGFFDGRYRANRGGPPRLGGYYYSNYCNVYDAGSTYRSVYSTYDGFPQYIAEPNVTIIDNSYNPVYATPYLPFYTPVYQTFYNQNNYYVATEGRVADLQAGGTRAKDALQHAYPANSFQAAFADIAHAWTDDDIDLVRRHLRDPDTRISVFLDGKYSYSIASSDFSQITRDALDRLHTVSFTFTRLRKAKNGDVTAYGAHVYRVADTGSAGDTGTVPFDQAGTDTTNASPYDQSGDPALGTEKTVYVSYTLRRYAGEWDIVATDSANHDLAASSNKAAE